MDNVPAARFQRFTAWAAVAGAWVLFVLVPLAWWPRDPYGLVKWVLMGWVTFSVFSLRLAAFFLSLIHISEPTRLLSISYAVFCLKKKTKTYQHSDIITPYSLF